MVTVEDGTGIPGADSYADSAFCARYLADRGVTRWAQAAEAERQAALVRACQYLDGAYGSGFPGTRLRPEQGMLWPRTGAEDPEGNVLSGIPDALRCAAAEGAAIELAKAGALGESLSRHGELASERMGNLARTFTRQGAGLSRFPALHAWMLRLVGSGTAVKVVYG